MLVSAGAGATPMLAMLHALAAETSSREVWWVHAARNQAEYPFQGEVDKLLDALPHAHRLIAYSQPSAETDVAHLTGRLDRAMLDDACVPVDADYYLCGPGGFMTAIGAALTARGVAPERVRTEIFGPLAAFSPGVVPTAKRAPHPPAGTPGTGPTVAFSRSNLAVAWDDRFGNLLELAEACDVPVNFGCRTGVCHSCESGLLSGDVSYHPEPLEPAATGNLIVCCARPASDLTLDL